MAGRSGKTLQTYRILRSTRHLSGKFRICWYSEFIFTYCPFGKCSFVITIFIHFKNSKTGRVFIVAEGW